MQFKVPQNIDMQDKILGPLTLFQLMYLLIGFLFTYGLLRSGETALFVFVGIPVGILALALAFIKVNEQPFSKFLTAFILFIIKPKMRVWHKGGPVPRVSVSSVRQAKASGKVVRKSLDKNKLSEVVSRLDE